MQDLSRLHLWLAKGFPPHVVFYFSSQELVEIICMVGSHRSVAAALDGTRGDYRKIC
jgi:hypothetical protein